MLVCLLGVAHKLQCLKVALARLVKHFAPQVMVSGVELAVEADGRRLGSAVDAVSQVVAVHRLLPPCLKYTHSGDQLVEQFGQLFFCGAKAALHGALCVAAFFCGGTAFFLQSCAGSL